MRKLLLIAAACVLLVSALSSCGKTVKEPGKSSEKTDSFENITIEDKAADTENAHWERYSFDGGAAVDHVLVSDDAGKSGSIIYKADNVTGIDLRGYRKTDCALDLNILVSEDAENWNTVTAEIRSDRAYTDWNWVACTVKGEDIPEGTKWVKIEIPPQKTEHELMLCDVQLLYKPEKTEN